MKFKFYIILFFIILIFWNLFILQSCHPKFNFNFDDDDNKTWTILKGGNSIEYPNGMCKDYQGNIYIVGNTNGSFDGQNNSGNEDVFIVKFNLNGNRIWTKFVGSNSSDYSRGIIVDNNGNIYITGSTSGNFFGTNNGMTDLFFARLDPNGALVYVYQKGSNNSDNGVSLVLDNNNNIYICGNTQGSFDGQTNSGLNDIFVIKYSNINSSSNHDRNYIL